MNTTEKLCIGCGKPLTAEEVTYYGHTCDTCEGVFSYHEVDRAEVAAVSAAAGGSMEIIRPVRHDYKKLATTESLELCPCCGASPQLWRYSESDDSPTAKVVMCSTSAVIGPQDGLANEGCLLYMPPNAHYRATEREAIRFWNEFARAMGTLQRKNRWEHRSVLRRTGPTGGASREACPLDLQDSACICGVRTCAKCVAEATPHAAGGVPLTDDERAELLRIRDLINTPHTADWRSAVELEATHQQERWGAKHDAGKDASDWFWLLGYLSGKALAAFVKGDTEKGLHHIISSSAVLLNWHRHVTGTNKAMRPGIVAGIDAADLESTIVVKAEGSDS